MTGGRGCRYPSGSKTDGPIDATGMQMFSLEREEELSSSECYRLP